MKLPTVDLRFLNYCSCAGIFNFATFFYWCCFAIVAIAADATPLQLGIMQALSAFASAAGSPVVGWANNKVAPWLLARAGMATFGLGCAALACAARDLLGLSSVLFFVSVTLVGFAIALFWPTIQTSVGKEAGDAKADRRLAAFAVFWSAGKSVGYIAASYVFMLLGATWSIVSSAIVGVSLCFVYPLWPNALDSIKRPFDAFRHQRLRDQEEAGEQAQQQPSEQLSEQPSEKAEEVSGEEAVQLDPELAALADEYNSIMLPICWGMNFCNYGTLNVLNSQLGKFATTRGISLGNFVKPDQFLGVFMCLLFATQTLALVALATIPGKRWQYRRSLIYLAEFLFACAMTTVALVNIGPVLLLCACVIGACAGLALQSSVNYSMRCSKESKGTFLGLNETVVSCGSFAAPLAAGFLASALGDLRLPYLMCGGLMVLCSGLQELLFQLHRRGVLARAAATLRSLKKKGEDKAAVELEEGKCVEATSTTVVDERLSIEANRFSRVSAEVNRTSRVSCDDSTSAAF
eukprot:TRINITY_DN2020_c0_g2_i1.p1 TRINITY_DN2020_c0_g2~~TRINITY_DN2020_c0_g2_i1.p1  ORF type:complete len:551 (-),score=162.21 TRINITY_DN2020_c0_g2_i1:74-1636(-)